MDVDTSEAIEHLSKRLDTLEESLQRGFRAGLAENRQHSAELFERSRQHTDVLFESLKDDSRLLAEGMATLTLKIDSRR